MNSTIHLLSSWGIWIIPLALVLVAAVGALRKVASSARGEQGQKYKWEGPVIVISLYCTLIGAYLQQDSATRREQYRSLSKAVQDGLQSSPLPVVESPKQSEITEAILDQIEQDVHGSDSLSLTRAFFLSGPLPGNALDDDWVVSESFKAHAFILSYLVGYPARSQLDRSRERLDHRRHMLSFLFLLLTHPEWDSLKGYRDRYEILYVPRMRSYDSWSISTSAGDSGGIVSSRGSWSDPAGKPAYEAMVLADHPAMAKLLVRDHTRLRELAVEFLERELRKPVYERAPCVIFCTEGATMGLRPQTLPELRKRKDEWLATWRYETQGTGAPRSMPPGLAELASVVEELAGK